MIPGNADVPTSLCAIQVRWPCRHEVVWHGQSLGRQHPGKAGCCWHTSQPLRRALLPDCCAVQEGFKDVVVAAKGFEYKPDRPREATFVGQKVRWRHAEAAGGCLWKFL